MPVKARRRWLTVVGFYPDNNQLFTHHVVASSSEQASVLTKEQLNKEDGSDTAITICAVFEGKLSPVDSLQEPLTLD
jgi:hypothetical protein